MALKSILLKIARAVLNQVLNVISQQIQRLMRDVTEPFQQYLSSVVDGAWEGEDADKFKDELQRLILPKLEGVTGVTTRTRDGIQQASEIIDRADQRVSQLVGNLKSEFSKIY